MIGYSDVFATNQLSRTLVELFMRFFYFLFIHTKFIYLEECKMDMCDMNMDMMMDMDQVMDMDQMMSKMQECNEKMTSMMETMVSMKEKC
jgi:hypothetical protein